MTEEQFKIQKTKSNIFNYSNNINYIRITLVSSIIIWILFKQLYTKPFITADSYFYIKAAYNNSNAGYWPIGYSKFLRLIITIARNPYLLVTTQFIISQFSLLIFFLSIRTIFNLNRLTSNILFISFLFNPLLIFANNHVMSDSLFMSFSLLWICQLLWILVKPKSYMIILQAILLLVTFTIRYSGLYYPIITLFVYWVSNFSLWKKIGGITISFFFLSIFIQFTRLNMEKIGGLRVYSAAAGWKQASNALYMYQNIANTDNSTIPGKFREIHSIIKNYFKNNHPHVDLYHIDREQSMGCFYMNWYNSPLNIYARLKDGKTTSGFEEGIKFSDFLNEYATYLIFRHPIAFFKFVLLPNITAYILPYPEMYGPSNQIDNLLNSDLGEIAKKWFSIDSTKILSQYVILREKLLLLFPYIFTIINLLFFPLPIILLISRIKINKRYQSPLQLLFIICILNFIFTIITTTSVMRFQLTNIISETTIITIISSLIYKTRD